MTEWVYIGYLQQLDLIELLVGFMRNEVDPSNVHVMYYHEHHTADVWMSRDAKEDLNIKVSGSVN